MHISKPSQSDISKFVSEMSNLCCVSDVLVPNHVYTHYSQRYSQYLKLFCSVPLSPNRTTLLILLPSCISFFSFLAAFFTDNSWHFSPPILPCLHFPSLPHSPSLWTVYPRYIKSRTFSTCTPFHPIVPLVSLHLLCSMDQNDLCKYYSQLRFLLNLICWFIYHHSKQDGACGNLEGIGPLPLIVLLPFFILPTSLLILPPLSGWNMKHFPTCLHDQCL